MDLFAKERQAAIGELVKKESAITTVELTRRFGISLETARRDLLDLEKEGVLRRVHGGAICENKTRPFCDLKSRNMRKTDEKEQLCRLATEYVCENDIIGIDSGSTSMFFARALAEKFNSLTVVTHSLDVFEVLARHRNFKVILCAGHFQPEENAFFGPLVLQSLETIHVQKLFMFPSAISLGGGICDYEHNLAQVQLQLCACASEIFVLADSSKFETHGLLKIADMSTAYNYITDNALPDNLKKLYIDNHINIITPEKE